MRNVVAVAATVLSMAASIAASAANLVHNGDFDQTIEGWAPFTDAPVLELYTLDGFPSAPSLHLSGSDVTASADAVSDCIPVDTTTNFDVRSTARVSAGQGAIAVLGYSDSACNELTETITSVFAEGNGRWEDLQVNDFPLPVGTRSVRIGAVVQPSVDRPEIGDGLFDHFRFGRTGTIDDGINLAQEGLTGTWFDPDAGGQGFEFSFTTSQSSTDATLLFGAWFTYDLPSDDPAAQRWYSLQGSTTLGTTEAGVTIYRNVGGNFSAPPSTSAVAVGTGTIRFLSCSAGFFTYAMDDGREGSVALRNLLSDPECTTAPTPGLPLVSDFGLSGTFYDPSIGGQGFMVQVDPFQEALFLGWYTYALDGSIDTAESQRWFSAQGAFPADGDPTSDVDIYVSTGGGFTFAGNVDTVRVGSGHFTFTSCSTATFDYKFTEGEFGGIFGTIDLVRLGDVLNSCPFLE